MQSPICPSASVPPLFAPLAEQGLNLHAVFDLASLPTEVRAGLGVSDKELMRYRQLILIGHLGRDFWQAANQRGLHGTDPLDQHVSECVMRWMVHSLPGHAWHQVFPGPAPVGLQRLGDLAGWHHPSPFWVGVDAEWGSWFAYRAVVLADTDLPVTPRRDTTSPCERCTDKPCISACPAGALTHGKTGVKGLQVCLDERKRPGTACMDRCLARNACPVGAPYRYSDEQIAYHYLQSMRHIRESY